MSLTRIHIHSLPQTAMVDMPLPLGPDGIKDRMALAMILVLTIGQRALMKSHHADCFLGAV